MSQVMPEVVVQRTLQVGIKRLRENPEAFNEIFGMYCEPEMNSDYGQEYIDKIRNWFNNTKVPVIQGYSINRDRIPAFSITLASESEDEQKAAIGDHFGEEVDNTVGVNVMSVMVDVGIHADKSSEQVLWLYYIMSYIFFKEKRIAERLGVQLQTWSASDYSRDQNKDAELIYSRWVRFKCTTQNAWVDEIKTTPDNLDLTVRYGRVGDPDDDLV